MYNTNTASVNTTVKVTALTSDTLYRLAAILKGNRYATIETTEAEAKAIESNAYAANMGADGKEAAWVRFCELCLSDLNGKDITEEVKERIGCALNLDRYEVRSFDEDGDTVECGAWFSTFEEAKDALLEHLNDSTEAVRGFVYDEAIGDGVIEYTKALSYHVTHEYPSVFADEFNTAEEAANAISEWLTDSWCGEEAYNEMLDECYEDADICGFKYSPSEALKKVDPIAYRCGLLDWADGIGSDILYTVERMDIGDSEDFFGLTVSLETFLDQSYTHPTIKAVC